MQDTISYTVRDSFQLTRRGEHEYTTLSYATVVILINLNYSEIFILDLTIDIFVVIICL